MASFTALYDACVLYPAPLRDLLMHQAMTDLFARGGRTRFMMNGCAAFWPIGPI